MRYPSFCPIVFVGGQFSGFRQVFNKREQRLVEFRKISTLCRPIVHLCIDVDCILGTPRWSEFFVPYPLQIGGSSVFSRRRDKQIAAILEIKLLQSEIFVSVTVHLQAYV